MPRKERIMSAKEHAGGCLPHDIKLAEQYGHYIVDERLCHYAADAMDEKLEISRAKGRGGWWREECTIEQLKAMLAEHVDKGDMVDVMNIAAMIWAKEAMAEVANA